MTVPFKPKTNAGAASPDLASSEVAIQCKVTELFYGDFLAVRDSHVDIKQKRITG
jgi:phosphate transport system ATP-binding protein